MRAIYFLIFLCLSCSYGCLEDVVADADNLMELIANDLSKIKNKEELNRNIPALSKRFLKLSELIILADRFQKIDLEFEKPGFRGKGSKLLYKEMIRLYQIHGARELIEKAQLKGLKKLEKYEETKESLR